MDLTSQGRMFPTTKKRTTVGVTQSQERGQSIKLSDGLFESTAKRISGRGSGSIVGVS
jgi:hypothetical protein